MGNYVLNQVFVKLEKSKKAKALLEQIAYQLDIINIPNDFNDELELNDITSDLIKHMKSPYIDEAFAPRNTPAKALSMSITELDDAYLFYYCATQKGYVAKSFNQLYDDVQAMANLFKQAAFNENIKNIAIDYNTIPESEEFNRNRLHFEID